MFGIFKKKSKREKLLKLYNKKKEEAFNLSKIDRRKSDEKEKEASDILDALDKLDNNTTES
tara:strand:+ start:827 stop:1009 length:183 start_codon:yes stop_codon:yes gene_type:complete